MLPEIFSFEAIFDCKKDHSYELASAAIKELSDKESGSHEHYGTVDVFLNRCESEHTKGCEPSPHKVRQMNRGGERREKAMLGT